MRLLLRSFAGFRRYKSRNGNSKSLSVTKSFSTEFKHSLESNMSLPKKFEIPVRMSREDRLAVKLDDFKMTNMLKSQSDAMEYKLIELENGLRAILVSDVQNIVDINTLKHGNSEDSLKSDDEETDMDVEDEGPSIKEDDFESKPSVKGMEEKMAACALCIGVGSFSDPPDIPGLAHFLEHMVFMGSKKHPQENGFDEFIKKRGGSDNGVTECETTLFYFECNEKYLKEGVDRFAQFFIEPLMKREAMTREREIINSEFEMALPSDGSRREQILGSLAPHGHPSGNFLWGNLITLRDNISDEVLYERVHEFRKRHYSAHRMTVAVQARLPIETLESYVRESFSGVPSNGLPPLSFEKHIGTFGNNESFHKLLWVKPVKDICLLHLAWILPSYMDDYKCRPLDYVGWLIGHEGEGSLVAYLRRKVWALDCVAGNDESGFEHNTIYALFTISLTLTEEGFKHMDEVLDAVFGYIYLLQQKCPDKLIYEELEKISEINFRYKTESPSSSYVETLAESMHLYDPEHYLAGGELYLEYKPELISEIVSNLKPSNVNIIVYSKTKSDKFYDRTEPWFQTLYKVEEIPEDWKKRWVESSLCDEFHVPDPNPYLATNFSILADENTKVPPHPVKIVDNKLFEMWYRQDVKFKRPIAYYCFYLVSPMARASALNTAMMDVLAAFLEVKFVEQIYPAKQAGLSASYSPCDLGLALQFSGYSDKLPLLFDEILKLISKCCSEINDGANEELFQAVMREKSRTYYNSFLKPEGLVKMARLSVLVDRYWTAVETRSAMTGITLQSLHNFSKDFFSNVRILSLIQGNILQDDAIGLCSKFSEILKCSPLAEPRPHALVAKLNEGETYFCMKSFNQTDCNSVVTNYYQAGPASIKTSCIIDILMMLMDEPLFDSLRTKQQIGYDVYCLLRDTHGVLGFSISVFFQANKFSGDEVDGRIEKFLQHFLRKLKSISKYELEETKMSLCEIKNSADLQLYDEVKKNVAEIYSGEYIFDRLEREVKTIPQITHKELCSWLEQHIASGKKFKKLSVQVIGSLSHLNHLVVDANDVRNKVFRIDAIPPTIAEKKKSCVSDIEGFKTNREFYPPCKTTL